MGKVWELVMESRICFACGVLVCLGLVAASNAQVIGGGAQQTGGGPGPGVVIQNTQNLQAISQTGLLPVFAVEMNLDPSWVDGDNVPSKSLNYSHNGVNDSFQGAWDLLKPGGFNAIRLTLNVGDAHSPARLANLCIWAKANNVLLIPVLDGGTASNLGSALLTPLISNLRAGDASNLAAYTQITYFQIEKSFNIAGFHTKGNPDTQKTLLSFVDALRSSESQALQGTGVQATPIMVGVSFDSELVQQGGMVGVSPDSPTEQKAQAALANDLAPFAADANVDAVNVSWFPGSISSGDQGHFAALLRSLQAAVPQKQLVLTTGFSTAFNSPAQQNQFFTITMTNLWDFRVSSGATSSSFVGVIFEQAFQGAKANLPAPAGSTDPSQWNWSEKAKALAQMWSGGKAPEDIKWWLGKVEANMGLLSSQPGPSGGANFVPSPGLQTFQQISATFAQAAQKITLPASGAAATPFKDPAVATNPGAISNPGAAMPAASTLPIASFPAGGGNTAMPYAPAAQFPAQPGMQVAGTPYTPAPQASESSSPSPYQQILMTLVQHVIPQITGALIAKMSGSPAAGVQPQYTGYPGQNAGSVFPAPGYGANPSTYQAGAIPAPVPTGAVGSPVPAGSISLGPQDVTVDAANAIPGQTVHVTAQVHNLNPTQDLLGLTVQLVDPTNPAASAQNSQVGILVPHSGITPVQFAWVAGQTSGNTQLSVQVLDPTGTPLANAAVPAISIMNAGSTSSGLVGGSPAAVPPSNIPAGSAPLNSPAGIVPVTSPSGAAPSPTTTNPVAMGVATTGNSSTISSTGGLPINPSPTNTGTNPSTTTTTAGTTTTGSAARNGAGSTSATQTSAGSGGQPASNGTTQGAQSTAVAPHIDYFGPVSVPGQSSAFLVQAVNPSPSPMSSVQAQIYVDGAAGQVVQLGLMLPQQSRSGVFDQAAVSANSQTVTVVVTTTDTGASTTASAAARSKHAQNPNSDRGGVRSKRISVRSGIPASSGVGLQPSGDSSSGAAAHPVSVPPTPLTPPTTQASSNSQTGATGQPGGNTLSNQTVPSAQSTGNASPSQPGAGPPVLSTPPTFQTAGASQPTGMTSNQKSTQTPSTGSVTTNQTDGGGSTSSAIPGGQTSTATSGRRLRTPPTVQPAGPGSAIPSTGGTLGPGPAGSTRTVRTIQPSSNPQANQTPQTIQPSTNGQVSQPTAAGQASNSSAPVQVSRTIQPPGGTPLSRPSGGLGYLDLSVSPSDIRIGPGSLPGQVVISVLIRNLGTVGANGASVIFRLLLAGKQLAVSGPMSFTIQGSGTYQARWITSVPPGQPIQLGVLVNAAGDVNPANNQAATSFTTPQTSQARH
jgi:hypothetical protein